MHDRVTYLVAMTRFTRSSRPSSRLRARRRRHVHTVVKSSRTNGQPKVYGDDALLSKASSHHVVLFLFAVLKKINILFDLLWEKNTIKWLINSINKFKRTCMFHVLSACLVQYDAACCLIRTLDSSLYYYSLQTKASHSPISVGSIGDAPTTCAVPQ